MTNIESIENLKNVIESKYNRITHIVSMAGDAIGTDIKGIEYVTIEDIDKTITYVSSINALRAYDVPVYSAAKAGLYGLTRGILQDLGKLGIRVNTISPGTILKPDQVLKNKLTNGEYAKKRPQTKYKEFAENTDIADALFCITHIMKKMVGQDIVIDAGQMA